MIAKFIEWWSIYVLIAFMKKQLVILILFATIFLSACTNKTNIETISNQSWTSIADAGSFCSINSTWTSACDTITGAVFAITTTAFQSWDEIPIKYSCMWSNINPSFEIFNAPKWTQSLAMIAHDPDAPDWDWIHWIVWNIPVKTTKIEEWVTPLWAMVGKNSRWKTQYSWPCPPSGTHKYFFKLYAISTNYLDLPNNLTLKQFEQIASWSILWTTEIYWTYTNYYL